jgi:hypothetical protein
MSYFRVFSIIKELKFFDVILRFINECYGYLLINRRIKEFFRQLTDFNRNNTFNFVTPVENFDYIHEKEDLIPILISRLVSLNSILSLLIPRARKTQDNRFKF